MPEHTGLFYYKGQAPSLTHVFRRQNHAAWQSIKQSHFSLRSSRANTSQWAPPSPYYSNCRQKEKDKETKQILRFAGEIPFFIKVYFSSD